MHVSYNFLWFFGNVGECDYYSLYVGVVVRWVWLFESRPLCTLWVSWSLSGCWVFWFVEISSEFFSAALVPNYGEMQKENSHAQIGKVCWCIAMRWSMKKKEYDETLVVPFFSLSPLALPLSQLNKKRNTCKRQNIRFGFTIFKVFFNVSLRLAVNTDLSPLRDNTW